MYSFGGKGHGTVTNFWPFSEQITEVESQKRLYSKTGKFTSLLVTNNLNKSAAVASFQKKNEEKSHFPTSFWLSSSKWGKTVCYDKSYNYHGIKNPGCT